MYIYLDIKVNINQYIKPKSPDKATTLNKNWTYKNGSDGQLKIAFPSDAQRQRQILIFGHAKIQNKFRKSDLVISRSRNF